MHKQIQEQIESNIRTLDYISKQIAGLSAADILLAGLDLTDVDSVSVSDRWNDGRELTLYLSEDSQGSKLPHRIAQHFGIELSKEKSWGGESLHYQGTINDEWSITIANAVPDSCTVVYSEEPIPEDQIVRTRKVAKIVCPGADSAS